MDVKRVGRMGNNVKSAGKGAADKMNKVSGQAQKAQGQMQQVQGQMPGQAPGMPPGAPPGMPGAPPGAPGAFNPNPEVKKVGLFGRKKVCTQCGQELHKSWDACPYCAQAAQQQAAPASQKTMAFMIDTAGGPAMQMLGWIVPVKGPQRGQLFTLAPVSVVGTEPDCTVVLTDQYMSSKHAEIKAEGGTWVLRDLGLTNGTFVNDKRIDQHELIDNDFVKFGQSLVKFKSL